MTVVSSYVGDEQMIAATASIKAMGTPFVKPLKRELTPILVGPCHRCCGIRVSHIASPQ
jgi:hypothetical protein